MNEQLREAARRAGRDALNIGGASSESFKAVMNAVSDTVADAVLDVIGLEQVTRGGLPLVVGRQGGNTTYWSFPKPPNPAMWSPVYTIRLSATPDPQPAPVEHPGP